MRKVWKEIQSGREWIVDADLKDFFGVARPRKTTNAGGPAHSRWPRAAPDSESAAQGGKLWPGAAFSQLASAGLRKARVVSPLLSNVLLTPFDREMRRKGHQLTRWVGRRLGDNLHVGGPSTGSRWLQPVKSWNS